MKYDNAEILKKLKTAVAAIGRNNISLPGNIGFTLNGNKLTIHLNDALSNMQENESSFEGWSICLKTWIGEIDTVLLSWKEPEIIINWDKPSKECQHYFRFLFRVIKFEEIFKDWFSQKNDNSDIDRLKSMLKQGLLINFPLNPKGISTSLKVSESIIETMFVNEFTYLLKNEKLQLSTLNQQLPVGIFRNEIKEVNTFLNRGKSAIDMWGVKDNTLHIFELKYSDSKSKNIKVGIISELFFYLCILNEVFINPDGCIKYPKEAETSNQREFDVLLNGKYTALKGYFLTNRLHPLISDNVISEFNKGLKNLGNISVERLDYEFNELTNQLSWKSPSTEASTK